MIDYVEDNNNQNKLPIIQPTSNKGFTVFVNILAIALLVSGGYGIKYIFDRQQDIKEAEEKRQELLLSNQRQAIKIEEQKNANKELEKTNPYRDFGKLKEKNSDIVAWLYVPGTKIDMPIVQADDNTYYLTHDVDREYNSMGWAFADAKNTFPDLSTNTIMYGHTYKRTAIFSNLKNVLDKKWLNDKSKHVITFDTAKERLTFKVFSVYTTNVTNDYLKINFENAPKYKRYLDREKERSIKDFKVNVASTDKIITLSTCYVSDSERLILHAKLIGSE